jgi:hypothetical protein
MCKNNSSSRACPLKMGPTRYTETSVKKSLLTLRNFLDDQRYRLLLRQELQWAILRATCHRVQSPVSERAASKLATPITRKNENSGHSPASSFDISDMN